MKARDSIARLTRNGVTEGFELKAGRMTLQEVAQLGALIRSELDALVREEAARRRGTKPAQSQTRRCLPGETIRRPAQVIRQIQRV